VLLDAAEDLGAVDLAQHVLRGAEAASANGMPQPLQWNIGRCGGTRRGR
jgi:hypothetical protein